jgi:hypothetical protein
MSIPCNRLFHRKSCKATTDKSIVVLCTDSRGSVMLEIRAGAA